MAERNAYPSPSINRGHNLLTDLSENDSNINKLKKLVSLNRTNIGEKQKPTSIKVANFRGNDCLNYGQENIIFNNSNNMILNSNTLNSFFEKLAEMSSGSVVTETNIQSSSSSKNYSSDSRGSKSSFYRRPYSGQRLARNYTSHKSSYGDQNIKPVKKIHL